MAVLHCERQLVQRAWRAWVVAWCREASARAYAGQLATKTQAAVLCALADNVVWQRRKRAAATRAATFRRARLLLLCVRWWLAWAQYSRVLAAAGSAVQEAARARAMARVLGAWRAHANDRTWQADAGETAAAFYWSRMAATTFDRWRDAASAAAQGRCAVAAFTLQRQRRQQAAVLRGWWLECVGNNRSFEMQVRGLVRLVGAAFKAWRQLAAAAQLHQQHGDALLPRCFGAWQAEAAHSGLLQQRQVEWQAAGAERQQLLQRQVLLAWCGLASLRKLWQAEAPLLAAAYYQEQLLRKGWAAWRLCCIEAAGDTHQQQPCGDEQQPPEQLVELDEQLLQLEHDLEHQQQHDADGGCEEEEASLHLNVPQVFSEPSLQEILYSSSGGGSAYAAPRAASPQQQQQEEQELACGAGAAAAASAPARASSGGGSDVDAWRSWQLQQQQQQAELLQLAAAQRHHAAATCRRVFTAWLTVAAAGAALMAQQAQLKHAVQLQLCAQVQQRELAAAMREHRLLQRPFEAWLGLVTLKASAAQGFRAYGLLCKGVVGWREGLALQQQEQQQAAFQEEQQAQLAALLGQASDEQLPLPVAAAAAGVVGQEEQQQQEQPLLPTSAAAAAASGRDMQQCEPLLLEDSEEGRLHRDLLLPLTQSEAAFAAQHNVTVLPPPLHHHQPPPVAPCVFATAVAAAAVTAAPSSGDGGSSRCSSASGGAAAARPRSVVAAAAAAGLLAPKQAQQQQHVAIPPAAVAAAQQQQLHHRVAAGPSVAAMSPGSAATSYASADDSLLGFSCLQDLQRSLDLAEAAAAGAL